MCRRLDQGLRAIHSSPHVVAEAVRRNRREVRPVDRRSESAEGPGRREQGGFGVQARADPSFGALDRSLKKLESKVLSETISRCTRARAETCGSRSVTFNGKSPIDLAIDTGASTVTLPYKVAIDAGLAPSGNAPSVQAMLADGHIIECKQVYAQTVRLGKFTVENVEIGVMPADCPNASACCLARVPPPLQLQDRQRQGKVDDHADRRRQDCAASRQGGQGRAAWQAGAEGGPEERRPVVRRVAWHAGSQAVQER